MRKKSRDDLSAEFIITIWRDNIGTNDATDSGANDLTINTNSAINIGTNIGTSGNSVATDLLVDEYFFIIPCLF